MRRWLGWVTIAWLLLACGVALFAYGTPSARASIDERTRAVALQLRCPVCQGESVADSPSDISKAMRLLVRRKLQQGESPAQIKAYFVSKYGNFILLSPPSSGVGGFAWLAPPLLLVGGAALLLALVFDWRSHGRGAAHLPQSAYLERVRAELAADGGSDVP